MPAVKQAHKQAWVGPKNLHRNPPFAAARREGLTTDLAYPRMRALAPRALPLALSCERNSNETRVEIFNCDSP
jgi:hypothetical protein